MKRIKNTRKSIEVRDQELVKKFRKIIHNKEKKSVPKDFPRWPFFLLTTLILSCSMILIFKQHPTIISSKALETSSREQGGLVPAAPPASNADTVKIKLPSDAPEGRVQKQKDKVPELKSPDSDPGNPILKKDIPAAFSNQNLEANRPLGIRIEEIVSCSNVYNKQYIDPHTIFSISHDARPRVWMKVISETPPFTLNHVYYFNGKKYCEVPLAIRYQRMRTWSSVTLRPPDHIGKWRVEVIDDNGVKLGQVKFTVVK